MRLYALDSLLQPILEACEPVPPERRKPVDAFGAVLASAVRALAPAPPCSVALRDGLAVRATDLVGASPSSPVVLRSMPPSVRGGGRLPDGCDAVLDPELATGSAPFVEIIETIAPGTHVRLPGHDLAAGEIIAPAGARVDASTALACRVVGIESIEVRSPRVGIDLADAAITRWLAAELDRLGCSMVSADEVADLRLRDASGTGPRLAIRPGEAGWIERSGGEIVIEVPGRFDGAMGAYTFLVLPVLARLFGLSLREIVLPVSAKIASAIGSSDLVLLSATNTALAPLCAGDMPLRAFARASHFLVIPPDSEGLDASTPVAAISLAEPFGFEMASEE